MTTSDTGTASGLYAYALLHAGTVVPGGVRGVGQGAPVGRISHEGLDILVSDVDTERLRVLSDGDLSEDGELATWARAHDAVVRAAFAHGAVLPFRFGTVLLDRGVARRLLVAQHDTALAMLAHVRDRVEWGVRVRRANAPQEDAEPADRGSGTAYLAARRRHLRDRDERRARGRDTAVAIRDDLAASAADVTDRAGGDAIVDAAVLVDHSAEDGFLRRAAEHAARAADAGLTLDVTGPWPPYSFAHIALEVADA